MSRQQPIPLERLRVASPCPVSWDSMGGGERARHCRECDLNVYDLSAMTRREAEELIASTEGRLCARLYRRADGTVLTANCPVGWRAVRRRASLRATAALTALLSLFGVASAQQGSSRKNASQKPQKKEQQEGCRGQFTVRRRPSDPSRAPLSGTILDPTGAVIAGAAVTLTDAATKKEKLTAVADDNGVFKFAALPAGTYEMTVASPGFKEFRLPKLVLEQGEAIRLDAVLEIGGIEIGEIEMGIIVMEIDSPRERVMKIDGITIRYEE